MNVQCTNEHNNPLASECRNKLIIAWPCVLMKNEKYECNFLGFHNAKHLE